MPNRKLERLLRALSRQGLDVAYHQGIYQIRWSDRPDAPVADILLPADLPVEAKAFKQLANLALVRHPEGGQVCRVVATPDVHPGDSGVAIGSVVYTQDQVIPAAVGADINCGMRLHVVDLSVDQFLAQRQQFVTQMQGDYLGSTRDVTMTARAMRCLFQEGVLGWLDVMLDQPSGCVTQASLSQLAADCDRIFCQGSLAGHPRWVPETLVVGDWIRDSELATIGGGNHFVEVQWVDSIVDRQLAYAWGLRQGQLAFMIHSGSRGIGKSIGRWWRDQAKAAWPSGQPYPRSHLFPLSSLANPELVTEYLEAEATAANYGFVNRLLLAELLRLRLRQIFGQDLAAPLVYDLPHNITLPEQDGWITRKGACPAYAGQPVIIPGSMGAPSYLLVGQGQTPFCCSASHGAGRLQSRFALTRQGLTEADLGLVGVDCISLKPERRIEEAPIAYKPITSIIESQVNAGIVQVVARLQPILTFKA